MEIPQLRRAASRLTLLPFRSSTPLPGSQPSRRRGAGIGFLGYREYQYGDDIRHVDWNVTARHARPMLKSFEHEQASAFMLVLDASASMRTPTADKWHRAIDLAAIVALVGARESGLVGGVVVSSVVEGHFRHGRGMAHALAYAQWLSAHQPRQRQTALSLGVDRAVRAMAYPGVIVIFSDFLDERCAAAIRRAARRHTVVALVLRSADDHRLPGPGLVQVADAETGRRVWIDSQARATRTALATRASQTILERRQRLTAAGAFCLEASAGLPYGQQLRGLCQTRAD